MIENLQKPLGKIHENYMYVYIYAFNFWEILY